jgi:hypothetical protein
MARLDTCIALLIACLLLSTAKAGSFSSSALLAKRDFRDVLSADTVNNAARSLTVSGEETGQELATPEDVNTAVTNVEGESNSSNSSEFMATIPLLIRRTASAKDQNKTTDGKPGISWAWIGPNTKSQRCLSACPESIGANTWQLLAGMNGPNGKRPVRPLSFSNFSVQAVHGPCRQYAKDSRGLTKTYFGEWMARALPGDLLYERTCSGLLFQQNVPCAGCKFCLHGAAAL